MTKALNDNFNYKHSDSRMAILGNYQSNFKFILNQNKPGNNKTKLKGFVSRQWMGQPTEQSRDDFKDVQEVEVLSYKNFQKKFCGEAFFGMSSLTTQLIGMLKRDHFSCFGGWTHLGQRTKLDSKVEK